MQIKQDHPLPGLILQWRKLNALVTKVVSYLMVLWRGLFKFVCKPRCCILIMYLYIGKQAQKLCILTIGTF